LCPGSGEITMLFSLYILDSTLQIFTSNSHNFEISQLNSDIDRLCQKISHLSYRGNKSTIKKLINYKFKDRELREIIKQSIKLSGSSRKIFVEKSMSNRSSISASCGYTFQFGCDAGIVSKKPWKRKDARCAIIDGVIENISEIHHLLESASETKEPHVLFVRGLSDDVKNTLIVNKIRGTIDVIAVEIPVIESTINILNDIAAVCNSDVISSYKGDLISKSLRRELPTVESICVDGNSTSITNNRSKNRVAIQISEIKNKKDVADHLELIDLFEKRIKNLSSDSVQIKIGQSQISKNPLCVENIDKFFRVVSEISKHGFFEKNKIISNIDKQNKIEMALCLSLRSVDLNIIPTSSLLVSIEMARSLVASILSSGCILPSGDQ
jgi:chaperonin GroEL (HSP60 family)